MSCFLQEEKSKIEERRKLSEQNVVRLMKEKENAENMIASFKAEMEEMNRLHEQQLDQFEAKTKQMEDQLTSKVKEFELHVVHSNRKIEEIETASQLKSQLWNKKENIFQNYMNSQQLHVKVCLFVTCSNLFLYIYLFFHQFVLAGFKYIIKVNKERHECLSNEVER